MLNVVALMGRLTYEPELRSTPSGKSVINFQIACDRNYQAQGQERQADFIDLQAWGKTAEFIDRYFHKGSMIAVEGRIETNNYTDKSGNNRKAVTVVVVNASFCGSKQDDKPNLDVPDEPEQQSYNNAPPSYSNDDFEEIIDDDDDLPF